MSTRHVCNSSLICPHQILYVNLSKRSWTKKSLNDKIIRTFIGGAGLAAKVLYQETGPDIEPLAANNVIVIAPGLLTGTIAPTSNRTEVTTKSPLTGIIGTGNFGGVWGRNLRRAGYAAVILTGKHDSPVYLLIDDNHVELRSAKHIWGKDSWEATDAIKEEIGNDFSVMTIGQAGENLVKFACPIVDYHHAPARSHAGCVMGSKNLKAIAVRGTREIPIASPKMFKDFSQEIKERIQKYPERGLRQKVGSNYGTKSIAEQGALGGKNYQWGTVPKSSEIWRIDNLKKYLIQGPEYGYKCTLAPYYGCNLTAVVKKGKYEGMFLPGVCFSLPGNTWGGKCGIQTYPAMWKCRELCQKYGMDQVNPVPFALELYQRGIVDKKDTDGLELTWGNEDAIMELLFKIAHREGFGDILADGSKMAAKKIGRGAEKYVMAIKGMEILTGTDPRAISMPENIGNITCARGGDDVKSTHYIREGFPDWARRAGWAKERYLKWFLKWLDMFEEIKNRIYGIPPKLEPSTPEGVALLTKWYQDICSVFNSLGICLFAVNTWKAVGPTHCAKLFSAYTGWDITPSEIMQTGERIYNLMRLYNMREGLTRSDDDWPLRFYNEPLRGGPAEGTKLSKCKINQLLDCYYELRGWDKITGNPTEEKLEELGLKEGNFLE